MLVLLLFAISVLAVIEDSELLSTECRQTATLVSADKCCQNKVRNEFGMLQKHIPVEAYDVFAWDAQNRHHLGKEQRMSRSTIILNCQDYRKVLPVSLDGLLRQVREYAANFRMRCSRGYRAKMEYDVPLHRHRIDHHGALQTTTTKAHCVIDETTMDESGCPRAKHRNSALRTGPRDFCGFDKGPATLVQARILPDLNLPVESEMDEPTMVGIDLNLPADPMDTSI